MTHVGVINPSWSLHRHNTDHQLTVDFLRIADFSQNLSVDYAGCRFDYLKANANLLGRKLMRRNLFQQIALDFSVRQQFDAFYSYGVQPLQLVLSKQNSGRVLATVGFPNLRFQREGDGALLKEAAKQLKLACTDLGLIHFHTDSMREHFVNFAPEFENKCVSIPFFLPYLSCIDDGTLLNKHRSNGLELLFVGVDGKRKGLDDLCVAMDMAAAILHKAGAHLTVVSKLPPSCRHFQNMTYFTKLPRTEIQALMRRAHIYVMVPHLEAYGLVYIEAMAAGCAVIADDDFPRQEILEQGRYGRLIEPKSPKAICEALVEFVENREVIAKQANDALIYVNKTFIPQVVAEKYKQAFDSLKS